MQAHDGCTYINVCAQQGVTVHMQSKRADGSAPGARGHTQAVAPVVTSRPSPFRDTAMVARFTGPGKERAASGTSGRGQAHRHGEPADLLSDAVRPLPRPDPWAAQVARVILARHNLESSDVDGALAIDLAGTVCGGDAAGWRPTACRARELSVLVPASHQGDEPDRRQDAECPPDDQASWLPAA